MNGNKQPGKTKRGSEMAESAMYWIGFAAGFGVGILVGWWFAWAWWGSEWGDVRED